MTARARAATQSRREDTAYHEAGHAVEAVILRVPFKRATIVPEEGSFGHVLFRNAPQWLDPESELNLRALDWLERRILTLFAGGEAEQAFRGRYSHVTAQNDRHWCIDYASYLFGFGPVLNAYLRYMRFRARTRVCNPTTWLKIKAIAEELLREQTLSAYQVRQLCRQTDLHMIQSPLREELERLWALRCQEDHDQQAKEVARFLRQEQRKTQTRR